MSTSLPKTARSPTVSQEFSAIIFAGLGGNLTPFSNPENLPKALLPLANKALISFPLSWVEKAGISTIIILCLDSHEAAISNWLKTTWKGSYRPTLVAASSEDEIVGTADAIRVLLADKHKDRIKSDVVMLSCDSICEVPPHELLDFHRLQNSSFTSIFHRNHAADVLTPLKKGSKSFTGYEASSKTLLYTTSEADLEDDDLQLRASMLWKFSRVNLTTALTDLHVYVCKRWVLEVINEQADIARINTDLQPLLCKAQFQSLVREKYGIDGSIRAKVFIPDPEYFCARANIKQNYIDLNKHLLKSIPVDARQPSSTTIGERSTIGPDSALGPDSVIDEKTTIKRSLLGPNIQIGKMCRITGCIIMDGVQIRDQVKLENCVICTGAVIGEKATLKDCTVGGKVTIADKSERKGEEIVMGGEITIGA